jgi:hypothetical protein
MTDRNDAQRLAELASLINAEHTHAEAAIKRGLGHALKAGELLTEAKSRLKHGQWAGWLAESCAVSARSARLYMRLFRRRADLLDQNGNVAVLSLAEAAKIVRDADIAEEVLGAGQVAIEGPQVVPLRPGAGTPNGASDGGSTLTARVIPFPEPDPESAPEEPPSPFALRRPARSSAEPLQEEHDADQLSLEAYKSLTNFGACFNNPDVTVERVAAVVLNHSGIICSVHRALDLAGQLRALLDRMGKSRSA